MSRLRRQIAFWWTFGATLVLAALLGSPFVGDRLSDHGNALLAQLIGGLRFEAWTYRPRTSMMGSIMVWLSPMIADLLLAALVATITVLAVYARGRFTALLAGWGLSIILAAAISIARVAAVLSITHPGRALAATLTAGITDGLWFGLTTGWVTGLVLACMVRPMPIDDEDEYDDDEDEARPIRAWTPKDPDWEDTDSIPPVTGPGARMPAHSGAVPPTAVSPTVGQPVQSPAQPWPPPNPGNA